MINDLLTPIEDNVIGRMLAQNRKPLEFFWGETTRGRRIGLTLTEKTHHVYTMRGIVFQGRII